MKKLATVTILLGMLMVSAGCDTNTPVEGSSKETVSVGAGKYDCTFENRHMDNATMSCTPISYGEESPEGHVDTPGFTRETIIKDGDKFDCIFENRGRENETMSCSPLAA